VREKTAGAVACRQGHADRRGYSRRRAVKGYAAKGIPIDGGCFAKTDGYASERRMVASIRPWGSVVEM